MTNPTPLALTLAELRELHALPDEALLNVQEAAAFLRLRPNALNWYRSQRRGPTYQRIGPKTIRYCMGDLPESPRVLGRLRLLREWRHEQATEVFTRGPGTGRTPGAGAV